MARSTPAAPSFSPLIGFVLAIAALYLAQAVLIPFALALLFAFVLSPLVKRLENWHVPRVPAVLTVSLIALLSIGGLTWIVADQFLEVLSSLPQYRENVHNKIVAVQGPTGSLGSALRSLEELGKELTTAPSTQPAPLPRQPAPSARSTTSENETEEPTRVQIVQPAPSALQSIRDVLGPLISPLGTAGIVIIFVIFMLLDREQLRNRLLRLIGEKQLHVTTKAMDDAGHRITRYLLLQFLVNAGFGAAIGLGLFAIGTKSFLLWGVTAALLRFLPYVGPVLAGAFPLLLALATTEGWRAPLLTIALFLVVELITGNAIEPWLYGSHTGLSAVALLVAAVFWTVLWGPVGLILSTPLTVCLGVLGRYAPQLEFLDVLLGDEAALPPGALFYQRLLALDLSEASDVVDRAIKRGDLLSLYDEVLLPALSMAEQDRHSGDLEARREEFLVASIHEIVTDLGMSHPPTKKIAEDAPRVLCLPASDTADEIAGYMLAQLLERESYPCLAFPVTDSPADLVGQIGVMPGDIICISSVPPLALANARRLSRAIRETFPEICVIVGIWTADITGARADRYKEASATALVSAFTSAIEQVRLQPKSV